MEIYNGLAMFCAAVCMRAHVLCVVLYAWVHLLLSRMLQLKLNEVYILLPFSLGTKKKEEMRRYSCSTGPFLW